MSSTFASSNNSLVTWISWISCLSAFGQHTCRRTGMPPTASPAFAATHRVSNGVHRRASYMGSATHMSLSTSLAKLNILVVRIAQPANCCPAFLANHSHFTTRQNDADPVTFFGHDFCSAASTSNQLSSLPRCHFNIMNLQTRWYRLQRHRITNPRFTRDATV